MRPPNAAQTRTSSAPSGQPTTSGSSTTVGTATTTATNTPSPAPNAPANSSGPEALATSRGASWIKRRTQRPMTPPTT